MSVPELQGHVALVTGAGRGIGAAIARALAAAGASVALAGRNAVTLDRVARELSDAGAETIAVPTDVTDPDAVARLVDRVTSRWGRLDIACNNAGGNGHAPAPLAEVRLEDFDRTLAVNLRSVFLSMRAEIPAMLRGGGGAILNLSSTAGLRPVSGLAAYVSAKHGLEGLTRVAALDYADQGIRVNALAPGPVLTDGLRRAGPDARKAAAAAVPLGRIGAPDDIAGAAVWLCSSAAAFVTGATLPIDGGKLAGTLR